MGVSVECIENFQIKLLVPINMNELKHGNAEGDLFIEKGLESIIRFELLGNISICEGENCCSSLDNLRVKELLFQRSFLDV